MAHLILQNATLHPFYILIGSLSRWNQISNVLLLVLFVRVSRKAKAAAVAEEKDQKTEDEKEIDNGLVLLLRSIVAIRQQHDSNVASQRLALRPACLQVH